MKSLAENNLVKFVNITRKKEGIFANFKVNGIKGGATFSSRISVSFSDAEVDLSDPLEKIIEQCAKIAVKEYKQAELQFEGIHKV
jgi:hypothetical protein